MYICIYFVYLISDAGTRRSIKIHTEQATVRKILLQRSCFTVVFAFL